MRLFQLNESINDLSYEHLSVSEKNTLKDIKDAHELLSVKHLSHYYYGGKIFLNAKINGIQILLDNITLEQAAAFFYPESDKAKEYILDALRDEIEEAGE